MRWRGSVRKYVAGEEGCVADNFTVFRAAHDSSKATRVWMGEMKKKS